MKEYTIQVKELPDGRIYYYDSNNNEIHYKNTDGFEYWKEYDENDNEIHYKSSYGLEYWLEYDENNNLIHYKSNDRFECWREYDENNNLIHYKDSNGKEYFYINNKIVTKEEWEKKYKKCYKNNKITINGKEYKISDKTIDLIKQILQDMVGP